VVVENRPGAAGQIATQDVLAKPRRTGTTCLLCTHFEAINAAVYKSVPYKLADIAPVSQVSRYYYGVVAVVVPRCLGGFGRLCAGDDSQVPRGNVRVDHSRST